MLLSDLIQPQANPVWQAPGGPVIPVLPKSQSNATATPIGIGPQPKQSTPAEILAAITGMQTSRAQIALTDAQKQEILAKLELMKKNTGTPMPQMYSDAPAGAVESKPAASLVSQNAGDTDPSTAADLVKKHESGGDYNIGTGGSDLSQAPKDANGFPVWDGIVGEKGRSHAAGAYQFQPDTWAQYAEPLGIKDFSPESQDRVFQAAFADQGWKPWAPFNPKLAAAIQAGASRVAPGQPTRLASAAPMTMNDASLAAPQTPLVQLEQNLREKLGIAPPAQGDMTTLRDKAGAYQIPSAEAAGQIAGAPGTTMAGAQTAAPLTRDQQNARLLLAQNTAQSAPTTAAPITQPTAPAPGRQPTQAWVNWARDQANADAWLGRTTPAWIVEGLQMAPGGSKSPEVLQQSAGATAAGQFPTQAELKKLEGNINIQNELAKAGKRIVNGQIVAIPGFNQATQDTAAATEKGTASERLERLPPGDIQTRGGVPVPGTYNAPLVSTYNPQTGNYERTFAPAPPGMASGLPGSSPANGVASTPIEKPGPAQETEQRDIGAVLGKEYGNSVAAYEHAQNSMPVLTTIENAMTNFRTGPFAGDRLKFGQAWQDIAQTLGAKPDSDLAKWIASGEIINKEGTRLGYELARTLGSREAQMIVQQAIASNPGIFNSPAGNDKLIGLIKNGLQRDLDRREFYDNWISPGSGHVSVAGAATAFDKAKPSDYYISQILPMHPKEAKDIKPYVPGTKYMRPGDPNNVYTVPAQ